MILQLSNLYSRPIAVFFLSVFYCSLTFPVWGNIISRAPLSFGLPNPSNGGRYATKFVGENNINAESMFREKRKSAVNHALKISDNKLKFDIGGPGQPEMSSFKSVGTDNMVSLFTGDFSYNIPLLDVGGYPVNIFYNAGIGPEQEASWVGLGWNINPGNINRNMRGIPDDFNGNDTLRQIQRIRPNKTWGLGIGADLELMGVKNLVKTGVGAKAGIALNNYLGPSLDVSLRGSASLKVSITAGSEKTVTPFSVGAGVNGSININSRTGTTFSGGLSLTAMAQIQSNSLSFGAGLSTGYNSRSGIKALQINEQVSFNSTTEKYGVNKDIEWYSYSAGGGISRSLFSSTISFAKPSYIPTLRMPLTNTAWSGHFQVGIGSYGVAADIEAEVYGQKSEVAFEDTLQLKKLVGYMYYQNAVNKPDYVMDFTRFNDREITPNTQVISVPQYSYDVFSIQGEGTGGSIRAYRGDLGYVRDNVTTSKDKNFSIGADIDPPGHYGANFNTIKTPSTIGEWKNGNKLKTTLQFKKSEGAFENVYFRNPGENSVLNSDQLQKLGGANLVRFTLGGSNQAPTVESTLQVYDKTGTVKQEIIPISQNPISTQRNKRSQVVSFLSAEEAAVVGLDKTIKNYDNIAFLDNATDTLIYESIPRVDANQKYRKPHHISQINITEGNGKRYVYGLPVYNLIQKDFTFSVSEVYPNTMVPEKVTVTDVTLMSAKSTLLNDNAPRDGYVQITETPAYAHSFLLSGILSPDYVDVTNNGITEDDLGNGVKFNYTRIKVEGKIQHKWRTPLSKTKEANFNAGLRSEVKDDKGLVSYGERESWYLQSIESKTMIALFYISSRLDGKGPINEYGDIDGNSNFVKKLDSIALFNKADLRTNGLFNAKPIKTVHFRYSYLLCQNTPDNSSVASDKGKLTLDSIYFTYNGKNRVKKNKYIFSYSSSNGSPSVHDNPSYTFNSSDRWGSYKPYTTNPDSLKNVDYPYTIQNALQKNTIDQNASAWALKKIVLPSGGQIEVNYESDDYAFVQNRRAMHMMQIAGFGNSNNWTNASNNLYSSVNGGFAENNYVFINVPVACSTKTQVNELYLQGVEQLAFKIWVLMPKGPENITCYGIVSDYGVDSSDAKKIWVKLATVESKSPLSITTLEYLRQQLPGQAFRGYDVSNENALKQIGEMLVGMFASLKDAFTDPITAFRKDGKAMRTDLSKCFVRLNDPDGYKYGGGYRVKSVVLKDNWNAMTGQFTSSYGQQYNYQTTENFNGSVRTISSGVASYEPSIGGEENPFQTMIQVADQAPLGPTSYGAIEMPVMDAFFQSPLVGYSKVTVSSIKFGGSENKKTRSGIGKQVTEFYTAKEYPVYYSNTTFDDGSVKEFHQGSRGNFFNKYAYDYKAQSQGFLIAINDMHGKMKSQSSYAESDSMTRISYTENFYRNTGVKGLNETFSFVSKNNSGQITQGNMGIDVELMTDTREFRVNSTSVERQGQVDIFYFPFGIATIPTVWQVTGKSENIYRAVTTTKVINYHSVLDSVVVIDKGSQVSTKNLAYDAETGEVLVTRTNNEFNQPVYNTSYPAYWAYGGMGLAYKNIDAVYNSVNFSDGKITNLGFDQSIFESGDELLIKSATIPSTGCDVELSSGLKTLIWAFDKNKNSTSLITKPDFIFIDSDGNPYTMNNVSFRIIRSGHRNLLDAKTATVSNMTNPLVTGKLVFNNTSKVINAAAVEFKEKWQTDNDVIRRVKMTLNPTNCSFLLAENSNGTLETINPYRKGIVGNYRAYRNMVFYDDRIESDPATPTSIAANGFLKNFKLYWDFNALANLVPDSLSTQWVWNTKVNKVNAKGLELETEDALGIYTAAQYGYNKTMPVAITNNARSNEMFAEGFEDYGYSEALNNTRFNLTKRHVNFLSLGNNYLVNTDSVSFKAHSGKYVLRVGNTSSISLPVNSNSDFPALTFTNTNKPIVNKGPSGGDFTEVTSYSGIQFNVTYDPMAEMLEPFETFNISGANSLTYVVHPYVPNGYSNGNNCPTTRQYSYYISTNQYLEIPETGQYTFTFGSQNYDRNPSSGAFPMISNVMLIDTAENITQYGYSGSQTFQAHSVSWSNNFCLKKGVYKLVLQFHNYNNYDQFCATFDSFGNLFLMRDIFTLNVSTAVTSTPVTFFKNYSLSQGCAYTKAASGTESMNNPIFGLTPGKKMVLSAWVKENCGDLSAGIPCKEYTYTHNQIQVKAAGTTLDAAFTPTGPIIDGWQRYESVFTVPVNASALELKLLNSGAGSVFFDDIRIHPFNSNMKSYVYDPVNLRLTAELDANNYATFYEYDEEGTLIRVKAETREGIKTIKETRSSLQKAVQGVQ